MKKGKEFLSSICCLCLLVLPCAWSFAAGKNLIENPCFEIIKPGTNCPEDWELGDWTSPKANVKLELSEDSHSGKYSAKVSWSPSESDVLSNIVFRQDVKIKGKHSFRLKYFYKTGENGRIFCTAQPRGKGSKPLESKSSGTYKTALEWTELTYEFTTPPETEYMTIYLRNRDCTVWYDDVSLEEVDPAEIKRKEKLMIKNPGFEIIKQDTNCPEDWTLQEWTSPTGEVKLESSEDSHSDKYSAKIIWVSGGSNIIISQGVAVAGKRGLRLKYYFKTSDDATPIFCSVVMHGKKKESIDSRRIGKTSEWRQMTCEFITPPDTTALTIYLRSGRGTVWYDDVSLEEIDPAEIERKEKLMKGGLSLWYDFSEGSGSMVHDKSGNENTGKIYGAEFVKLGDGYVLKLDGKDDYVDCGDGESLDIRDVITIEAWVHPEGEPSYGSSGIVGKAHHSYVLMHGLDGSCYWYISGGANNVRMPSLAPDIWTHIAAVFDGKSLKLYFNGELAGEKTSKVSKISSGSKLYLGRSDGALIYTKDAHFKGMIGEVKIYNKVFSDKELEKHYQMSKDKMLSYKIGIKPHIWYADKEIIIELNLTGLGEVPSETTVLVELIKPGVEKAVCKTKLELPVNVKTVDVTLKVDDLTPGDYVIQSTAFDRNGGRIGKTSSNEIIWPGKRIPPEYRSAGEVLNNFVTELLNVKGEKVRNDKEYEFITPREGWIYISSTADVKEQEKVFITIDSAPKEKAVIVHEKDKEQTLETMQFLSEGKHSIKIWCNEKDVSLENLVVRAMPEILLTEYYPDVIERHKDMLKEINVIVQGYCRHYQENIMETENIEESRERLAEWRNTGRKVLIHSVIPDIGLGQKVSLEKSYDFWSTSAGFKYFDGIIVDEFAYETKEQIPFFIEALRKIHADKKFKNKTFYAYSGGFKWANYKSKEAEEFRKTIMECGYKFAPEIYLEERLTEIEAKKFIEYQLRQGIVSWQKIIPDSLKQTVVVLFCNSKYECSANCESGVDFKVFMDMQMNLIANDPAFFGLSGIAQYKTCRYVDEETLRWISKLYRHYCIKGKTNMLSDEYGYKYILSHIQNSNFEEGMKGWTVAPAEKGSIETGEIQGYGSLGKLNYVRREGCGDTFVMMKKNKNRANIISQEIRNLKPGKLYSVKLVTGDYKDISKGESVEKAHEVSIKIDNAELIPERCKFYVYKAGRGNIPLYDSKNRPCLNYHYKVFRAKSDTAKLVISDWKSDKDSGKNLDQQLMCNFIEVQPYFEN
ncbi:LamG domain-containing protein [bacterium]|nr:LamG domain-containing protein [bacterium]